MATAPQSGDLTNVSNNNIAVSVCLIVLIAITISVPFLVRRRWPHRAVSGSMEHPHVNAERHHQGTRSYILDSIPVVPYSARSQPDEQGQSSEIHDSIPLTHPLKKETTSKYANTPNYSINTSQETHASQSGEKSGLRSEPLSCSVCTEDFVESEDVRILPCGHFYHQRCIDPWLLDFASTCPLW
jgi:hypothetical protein